MARPTIWRRGINSHRSSKKTHNLLPYIVLLISKRIYNVEKQSLVQSESLKSGRRVARILLGRTGQTLQPLVLGWWQQLAALLPFVCLPSYTAIECRPGNKNRKKPQKSDKKNRRWLLGVINLNWTGQLKTWERTGRWKTRPGPNKKYRLHPVFFKIKWICSCRWIESNSVEELFFVHVDYPPPPPPWAGNSKCKTWRQRPTIQLIIKEEMLGLSGLRKGSEFIVRVCVLLRIPFLVSGMVCFIWPR